MAGKTLHHSHSSTACGTADHGNANLKAVANEETLLRAQMFRRANGKTFVADAKCFWKNSETKANGETFASATMFPRLPQPLYDSLYLEALTDSSCPSSDIRTISQWMSSWKLVIVVFKFSKVQMSFSDVAALSFSTKQFCSLWSTGPRWGALFESVTWVLENEAWKIVFLSGKREEFLKGNAWSRIELLNYHPRYLGFANFIVRTWLNFHCLSTGNKWTL